MTPSKFDGTKGMMPRHMRMRLQAANGLASLEAEAPLPVPVVPAYDEAEPGIDALTFELRRRIRDSASVKVPRETGPLPVKLALLASAAVTLWVMVGHWMAFAGETAQFQF
jgi:hypothetical protein